MKNILRSRPRTVGNRPTSGGWGNKKCFFRPTEIVQLAFVQHFGCKIVSDNGSSTHLGLCMGIQQRMFFHG